MGKNSLPVNTEPTVSLALAGYPEPTITSFVDMLPEPIRAGHSDGPLTPQGLSSKRSAMPEPFLIVRGAPTTSTDRTTTIGKRTRTISHVDSKPVGHSLGRYQPSPGLTFLKLTARPYLTVATVPQLQLRATGAVRFRQVESRRLFPEHMDDVGVQIHHGPPHPARHCTAARAVLTAFWVRRRMFSSGMIGSRSSTASVRAMRALRI